MGFDKWVGDDPVFPTDLLPRDRRYRPDLGDSGKSGLIVIFFFISIFAIVIFYRTMPMATTMEKVAFYSGLVLFIFVVLFIRQMRAGNVTNDVLNAIALAGSGSFTKAEQLLDDACLRSRANKMVHGFVVYERAALALRQGDIRNALGMAGAVYTSGKLNRPATGLYIYWGQSLVLLARCLALQGKTAEAEKWQTFARSHVMETWGAMLLTGDVILGIRTGRTATVLADAERGWAAAEATHRGWDLRVLRLLCAFGAEQLAPSGEQAQRWLASLHPQGKGEFAGLTKEWPELQAFVEAKGL